MRGDDVVNVNTFSSTPSEGYLNIVVELKRHTRPDEVVSITGATLIDLYASIFALSMRIDRLEAAEVKR